MALRLRDHGIDSDHIYPQFFDEEVLVLHALKKGLLIFLLPFL